MKIGIVGTGFIAEAIVDGLMRAASQNLNFVLSPRNAETASRLVHRYPSNTTQALSNQEVIDSSDVVILSVRPAIAKETISGLRFKADQTVVSVIAGIQLSDLRQMAMPATNIALAIPLPAMARGHTPFVLMPESVVVHELFSQTGQVVVVDKEESYAALGTVTALMASYFRIASGLVNWLSRHQVPHDMARMYVGGLLSGLADTASRELRKTFHELATEHATPGSFNEKLLEHFADNDFDSVIGNAFEPLLAKMTASND